VGTPTVTVIPPGVTTSAGTGTVPGRTAAPDATPSPGADGTPGSPGSVDPPPTRVIRIPASVGGGHAGSASAFSGAQPTRPRSGPALTARGAPSADAPPWEQTGSDGRGRIALVVLAVVVVCALVGGLAAFAATLGGTASSPHPAASIAPGATSAPGARAGTRVSRAGARHVASRRADSGRAVAPPVPTPTVAARAVTQKPTAKPAPTGKAGHRAGRRARRQPPKRPVQHRRGRPPARNADHLGR
jgi:hypothetical protein